MIAKSTDLGDENGLLEVLLSLVVLFLLAYTGLSVVLNNKRRRVNFSPLGQDRARFWQNHAHFHGECWCSMRHYL